MTDLEKIKKLEEDNDKLNKKLEEIAKATSEEAQAYSIFTKARNLFKYWILLWVTVVVLITGISYNKIIKSLTNEISKNEIFKEEIKKRSVEGITLLLKKDVKKEVVDKDIEGLMKKVVWGLGFVVVGMSLGSICFMKPQRGVIYYPI